MKKCFGNKPPDPQLTSTPFPSPVHKMLDKFSATLDFFSNAKLVEQLLVHRATFMFCCLDSHSHAPSTKIFLVLNLRDGGKGRKRKEGRKERGKEKRKGKKGREREKNKKREKEKRKGKGKKGERERQRRKKIPFFLFPLTSNLPWL